jgi:hypothetical protein
MTQYASAQHGEEEVDIYNGSGDKLEGKGITYTGLFHRPRCSKQVHGQV